MVRLLSASMEAREKVDVQPLPQALWRGEPKWQVLGVLVLSWGAAGLAAGDGECVSTAIWGGSADYPLNTNMRPPFARFGSERAAANSTAVVIDETGSLITSLLRKGRHKRIAYKQHNHHHGKHSRIVGGKNQPGLKMTESASPGCFELCKAIHTIVDNSLTKRIIIASATIAQGNGASGGPLSTTWSLAER
ncbi:uncharacterized protein EV422DRAFT_335859 [Fimicolochytrium jonesii]|uniref:uncharacterized protein n=1 Tax=Fimicolochytrium jonesii TaxID=1396493 RepID=UPI0022FE7CC8|nr:uncharacterized protein EV422DRAFT_335859 [Fimicolochytrium jonesii]KAI8815919.1 hypothetical protein EV422DRAFT_335859 [Fimicolochytrium jonesii]